MKNNGINSNYKSGMALQSPDNQQLRRDRQQQNEQLTPELRKYYNYLTKITKDSLYHKKYLVEPGQILSRQKEKTFPVLHFYNEMPADSLPGEEITVIKSNENVFTVPDSMLVKKEDNPITRMIEGDGMQFKQDWYLGVLLFTVMMLGWIRLFFNKELKKFFMAAVDNQLSHKVYLEQNSLTQRAALLLNMVFVINLSFFIHLILHFHEIYPFGNNSVLSFFAVCGIIVLIYILKFVVYKILGTLFLAGKYFDEYIHQIFLYHKLFGIILFPLLTGMAYMPSDTKEILIYSGFLIFTLSVVLRIFRGFQICFKSGVSLFYMILYLCTLEILPFAVLYKLLLLN